MNTTIPNNSLPKFTQATGSSGNGNGPATTAASPADSAATAPKTDDQLKLTDSALALQEAARTGDTSAIDSQRVEQLRQAVTDGSYKVDASRIADRMLALEQQLGGTGKA
jgi:negative regulator of flagellin synthesis FlgM